MKIFGEPYDRVLRVLDEGGCVCVWFLSRAGRSGVFMCLLVRLLWLTRRMTLYDSFLFPVKVPAITRGTKAMRCNCG